MSEELKARIEEAKGIYISKHYGECCESAVDAYSALLAVLEIEYKGNGVASLTNVGFEGFNEALDVMRQAIKSAAE